MLQAGPSQLLTEVYYMYLQVHEINTLHGQIMLHIWLRVSLLHTVDMEIFVVI